jgi:hypothetical protein
MYTASIEERLHYSNRHVCWRVTVEGLHPAVRRVYYDIVLLRSDLRQGRIPKNLIDTNLKDAVQTMAEAYTYYLLENTDNPPFGTDDWAWRRAPRDEHEPAEEPMEPARPAIRRGTTSQVRVRLGGGARQGGATLGGLYRTWDQHAQTLAEIPPYPRPPVPADWPVREREPAQANYTEEIGPDNE